MGLMMIIGMDFWPIEIINPPNMAPKTKFHIAFAIQDINGSHKQHMDNEQI